MQMLGTQMEVNIIDSFLFQTKPSLIVLLFFSYTFILLPNSMVAFKFLDCFVLVFFHQNLFFKSVKSFHSLLGVLHIDINIHI